MGLIAVIGAGAAWCIRTWNRWRKTDPDRVVLVDKGFRQAVRVVQAIAGIVEPILNALALIGGPPQRPAYGGGAPSSALGPRRIGESGDAE